MSIFTLNNLFDLFELFANNHYQLKRFGKGELYDIEDLTSDATTFPILWSNLIDVSYPSQNTKQYNFNILIFDILQNDKQNEAEIWSDSIQIAEDLIRFLNHNQNDYYEIVNTPLINTFTESKFTDFLAGCNLNISIEVDANLQNDCGIPMEEFDFQVPSFLPNPNGGGSGGGNGVWGQITGNIGDQIDLSTILNQKLEAGDNVSDLVNDAGYLTSADLSSSITFYPTTASSPIPTYLKLVTDISDPSYNTVAVNVSTGAIAGNNQLIASLASDEGIIIGQLGIFNVTTIGMIRKTAGGANATATFYFEIYKRSSGNTETLIAISDNTLPVSSATYVEFTANALFNDGLFSATDRIVLKFYGNKTGVGANPTFDFQFGGLTPVRTLIPVPVQALLTNYFNKVTDTTDDLIDTSDNRLVSDTQINTWNIGNFGITLDGIGGVISTGSKGYVIAPYACTIVRWDLIGDVSGSIVVDIKRSGTSIIGAGNKPTLSSQVSNGAVASSWTSLAIAQGDVLEFNVDSASTVTRINLSIRVNKI